MHLDPVSARLELLKDSSRCFEHQVGDVGLLLCKSAGDGPGGRHI
ncbi:MAG: hypothetical protein ACK56F_25680 [bacterium]